ncbi:hypothetical protein DPMN_078531 [Dreissena polymorpha]|uniref:B box-type domain-containing protein n=1 Tax=Dreissena polymorpha TaxID=45954 RepID=A0A9D3YRD2_DREPO|nr:hypothetical protein DPMN_078531 [Dreissena polymorpha]
MEDLLLTCDIHNKKLNMFCQDHDRLCCSDCVLLNHRTQEASIKCVDVSYGEKLQEIRDMRNKLNATLDELENTTLKKLDEIRSTLQTSLKEDVENCRRLKDKLQQLSEAVQNLGEKSNNEIQFTACRKCLEKIQESETFLKENPVKGLNTMKFQANIDIQQYLSKNSCLGRFVVMNPNQVLTVKRKSEYNVKRSNDTSSTCFIVGICSLPTGHVIVVDHNNKRVKLFDQQFNLVSYFEMSGQLRDVCQITSSEVAVTVESCVQFICVKDGQLVNGGRLNLRHRAVGIAHHYGQLYVTSSTALYHYTMSGTLVKMLYEDTGGGCRVFKCAVSPAGDRIYVTNCNQHTLLTLAMDGNLISTFTDTGHGWQPDIHLH